MIKKNKRIILILTGFLCLIWAACKEQQQASPCNEPTQASLSILCMHYAVDTSTVPVDTVLPYALFVSLGKTPAYTLYGSSDAIGYGSATYSLSLSPFSDTCKWAMIADSLALLQGALFDTLTFVYQRQLQFLSNACGYTYFYNLDTVLTTKHNIDSVIIENTSVTLNVNGTEQLEVFIHRDF